MSHEVCVVCESRTMYTFAARSCEGVFAFYTHTKRAVSTIRTHTLSVLCTYTHTYTHGVHTRWYTHARNVLRISVSNWVCWHSMSATERADTTKQHTQWLTFIHNTASVCVCTQHTECAVSDCQAVSVQTLIHSTLIRSTLVHSTLIVCVCVIACV